MRNYTASQAEYNEERLARFSLDDDSIPPDEGTGATRQIWVDECYTKIDFDNDGVAELRKLLK